MTFSSLAALLSSFLSAAWIFSHARRSSSASGGGVASSAFVSESISAIRDRTIDSMDVTVGMMLTEVGVVFGLHSNYFRRVENSPDRGDRGACGAARLASLCRASL